MVIDEDVATSDVDEAERLLARVYHRARILESGDPFRFEHTMRGDERVTVARYRVPSFAEGAVDVEGVLGIGSRVAGTFRAEANGDEVDPRRAFLLPPGHARSSSRRLDMIVVHLNLAALAGAAGWPEPGPVNLRVGALGPLSPGMQQQWDAVRLFAVQTLGNPALLREDLVRRSVGDLLIASALACFAVDVPAGRSRATDGGPATLRRAVQFVEDNASRPIGVEDIAEAARLSQRGLQDLFRRSLGTTPSRYLRTVRLDGVKAELERADAETVSVTEVAHRWGFAHVARFAGWYREAFGENPSRTLRR